MARDRFELISQQEFIDLERLQEDRHRCAHPSHTSVSQVFTPSAELARAHIRIAVDHLLQHPPAQGKAALERLLTDIQSEYFPVTEKKAVAVLQKTPLYRARHSLVRNLVLVLLKLLLRGECEEVRCRVALLATKTMHPKVWQEAVAANYSKLVRGLSEHPDLIRALQLTGADEFFREYLEEDQVLRLGEVIRQLSKDDVWILSAQPWLFTGKFEAYAVQRVERMTAQELDGWGLVLGYPPAVCSHIVSKYVAAESYHSANAWGGLIADTADSFDEKQVKAILEGAVANGEIQGSFQLPKVLSALRQANKITAELEPLVAQIE